MKNTDLKQMRDQALYESYIRCLQSETLNTLSEVADFASRQPAPQYFIDSRTISLIIGMIDSRISLINLNQCSRRKAWQLYDNYLKWKSENPDSDLSRERICEILVEEPAPEFYIKKETARKIIQRICMKRKQSLNI